MLNEDRIKVMTSLAMFEEGEGKKNIKISNYLSRDYISLNMMTTALWVTLGYLMLMALVAIMFLSEIIESLSSVDRLLYYAAVAIGGYVVIMIVYMIVAYRHFARKHRYAKGQVKQYYGRLRRLDRYYRQEDKELEKAAELKELEAQLGGE